MPGPKRSGSTSASLESAPWGASRPYLREAIDKRGGLENIQSLEELRQAVIEGAVHRLRPKLLTEGVAIIAFFPMVFAEGVGAEQANQVRQAGAWSPALQTIR